MKLKPCLLIALLLTATATAFAQGTFTFTPSSMGPIIPGNWPTSTNSQSFTFPTPAISLANYSSLQVTFSAPSGYAWQVTPFRQGQIFGCSVGYSSPGDDNHPSADYSFNFVPGMAGSVYGVVNQRLSESSFGFDAAFQFGGSSPVEFTDLTITLHYVSLHEWQVAQRPLAPFDQSSMNITYSGGIPDSHQHLFLVPTPEPGFASLAVLGAGLAMIATSGRRFPSRPEAESGNCFIPQ